MHRTRLIAVGALGTLLLAGCSGAGDAARATAGRWSPPVSIGERELGGSPALTFTGDGHAVATDQAQDDALARVLAAAPRSRRFAPIGRTLLLAAPAAYGADGVAYLRAPRRSRPVRYGEPLTVDEIGVSLGTHHSLGDLQILARQRSKARDLRIAIAGSPRGDVVVAWMQRRAAGAVLRLIRRAPGGRFGRPLTIARAITGVALAYGARGDLVVAFSRYVAGKGEVGVRVLPRTGAPRPIRSLGPTLGNPSLAVAVSPRGDAVVAWGTQDSPYDFFYAVRKPWTVRAAMLRSGAFEATQLLDPGGEVAAHVAGVSAAIAPDGTATVAWSGIEATMGAPPIGSSRPYPAPVRTATSRAGARFSAAEQIAGNGAALGVVSAADGTTTVLWGLLAAPEEVDDYVESLDRMYASRRVAGARGFASAQPLGPRQATVNTGALALDPASGRPAALWIAATQEPAEAGLSTREVGRRCSPGSARRGRRGSRG